MPTGCTEFQRKVWTSAHQVWLCWPCTRRRRIPLASPERWSIAIARIRTIKPEAFSSESLAAVSLSAERTFFGLLTQADDQGRFRDQAAVIAGQLWSLRREHGPEAVEDDLIQLDGAGLICRYEAGTASGTCTSSPSPSTRRSTDPAASALPRARTTISGFRASPHRRRRELLWSPPRVVREDSRSPP